MPKPPSIDGGDSEPSFLEFRKKPPASVRFQPSCGEKPGIGAMTRSLGHFSANRFKGLPSKSASPRSNPPSPTISANSAAGRSKSLAGLSGVLAVCAKASEHKRTASTAVQGLNIVITVEDRSVREPNDTEKGGPCGPPGGRYPGGGDADSGGRFYAKSTRLVIAAMRSS